MSCSISHVCDTCVPVVRLDIVGRLAIAIAQTSFQQPNLRRAGGGSRWC